MPHYFTERGKDHGEVLDKINKKYGGRAKVLVYKNVPVRGLMGLFGKEQIEYSGYIVSGVEAEQIQRNKDAANRAAILKSSGKTLLATSEKESQDELAEQSKESAKNDNSIEEVLAGLREIKEQISTSVPPAPEPFSNLTELTRIMLDNEFQENYMSNLIDEIKATLNISDLDNKGKVHQCAANFIAESIKCYAPKSILDSKIFVLIGPTGVGKTTTIAKLAAVHGLASKPIDVRIINIDSFRIGARSQIETYGTIMGVPVVSVDKYDELEKEIALASASDLVLVDTIGKSPREEAKLQDMQKLLNACGDNAQLHLAMSATTKIPDMREIMNRFKPFNYKSVVITKLDETVRVGGIISLIAESELSFSYLTDGQSVPVDIAIASPSGFLSYLKGLEFDNELISKKYSTTDITEAWR